MSCRVPTNEPRMVMQLATTSKSGVGNSPGGSPIPPCIAGERAGPPEDCGGIEAFHDMLACIKEPNTELGREWLEWLGPDYYPTAATWKRSTRR